ncbi:flagellar export chaperone FliS [Natribacillus halophilus]|uniref:Flagellar secretion chaperone FliS n=1 Tax=Natribacillus halophilus TaxID=549003 RepID=A0A1G8KNI9_9BACI|nr:flagellar export chaperone FliS [Natribacillus halophilus]SDI44912.1 flagellar protein FliS [Natribacillus halophilus]
MNYVGKQQNAYQQNALQTASPGELTLMLFNGCLKFMRVSARAIETGDHEKKNINITKAQMIVRELMVTLRRENETTEQMIQLYDFVHDALVRANIHNDAGALEDAETIMTEFRDTWKEVIRIDRKERHTPGVGG